MKRLISLGFIALMSAALSACCWPWGCRGGGGYYHHDGYHGGERGGDWHHDR